MYVACKNIANYHSANYLQIYHIVLHIASPSIIIHILSYLQVNCYSMHSLKDQGKCHVTPFIESNTPYTYVHDILRLKQAS